jgi:lipopolysaccharide/colanic/teichoic acid biosynthesis glycosyltransferase
LHSPDIFEKAVMADVARPVRRGVYRNGLKRVMDVMLVLLGGIVVLPVVLILALLIARDGHSPFYWNARVGRGGRVFHMLKLRSMVHDADARLEAHLAADPAAAAEWAATQKLKKDPRITTFGRILRKTSMDELPQLWNVLTGDMSLVGPRPMMPSQQVLYIGRAYYALRPGLTGPWQVSDRNGCAFAKRAEFDRDYEQSLSLATDLRLLARTVAVVLKGTGF